MHDSIRALEAQIKNRRIALTAALPDNEISIYGDEAKLKQVMVNIISNAIKFTPVGGAVQVTAAQENDGGLTLSVSDTGIGMSEDDIKCALELFGQVENGFARQFEGTGLGLPLAVQLIELHGGKLAIDSVPGTGTRVWIRLPAARIVSSPAARSREKQELSTSRDEPDCEKAFCYAPTAR